MNFIHSVNSSNAGRSHYRQSSRSSVLQKLGHLASKLLGITLATGSLLFTEPLLAFTPLAWGDGEYGQLGDGTFYTLNQVAMATPVQVSALSHVRAIAGGVYHSLALDSDGSVWAWGFGYEGQLGDGNFYLNYPFCGTATPVQVSGLTTATAIACGLSHSLALRSDGTVWAWGDGQFGQLGDGNSYTDENQGVATPVQVSSLTSVTAIACGGRHSLALKSDGTVWAWGANPGVATPVQVNGLTAVTAIACGYWHSLALQSDGTVWAWGMGGHGELGDGNFYDLDTPVQVSGLSPVRAIACGQFHSLAIESDGTVWAWGRGQHGQLGDGNFYTDGNQGAATPVQVSGLIAAVAIAAGCGHSLALKSDGMVWAWGDGQWGQLGDGNFYASVPGVATPTLASSLGQPVSAIAAGYWHNLALPAVSANTPPVITLPSDVNVSNDPGECSAVVNYCAPLVSGGIGNVVIVYTPASGSVFPVGTTTVTCTATDAADNSFTCSFNVTVNDTEPPVASYAVIKRPALFTNPPRIVGWFQLLATDNYDPDPLIYLKGSVGSFVAGPFHNGDQVEIAHGPSLIPRQAPSTFAGNIATIQLNGDALLWAVDSSGNASTPIKCK